MKNKIYLLLPLLFLISCNQNSRNKDFSITVKYGNVYDFVNQKNSDFKDEFYKYFEFCAEDMPDPIIKIVESSTYEYRNLKLFTIRLSAESNKDWSYCEKLIVVSNTGQILFETELTQYSKDYKTPECDVADYNIDGIFNIVIDKTDYVVLDVRELYWQCASQPATQKKDLRIFSIPELYSSTPINYYEWSSYLDHKIDTNGIEHIEIEHETIRIRETVYKDTTLKKESIREFNLNEII